MTKEFLLSHSLVAGIDKRHGKGKYAARQFGSVYTLSPIAREGIGVVGMTYWMEDGRVEEVFNSWRGIGFYRVFWSAQEYHEEYKHHVVQVVRAMEIIRPVEMSDFDRFSPAAFPNPAQT